MDTGAEVMALSETIWNSLYISVPLEKVEISLFGPDQKQLNVVGQKFAKLTYQEKSCSQNVFQTKQSTWLSSH